MLNRFLFEKIDNSPLIVFRILFGFLIACEGFGAIATGWVRRTLIEPQFTFNFIGFEFLQPLPGNGMYLYFALMGLLGVFIMIGFKYRFSMLAFALLWWGVYLMQKTSYNNHYYLLALISSIMVFLPAQRAYSVDARQNPELRSEGMFAYVKWIMVLQMFIVYTYAAIAKFYGDWLDFTFLKLLMESKSHYPVVGDLFKQLWFQQFIGISGLLFDLLIIPALMWKRSRNAAFGFAIFFHLFNSVVFQIGIFPYMALAFTVFFYEPETIRRIFLKKKPVFKAGNLQVPGFRNAFLAIAGIYFIMQLVLPVRHYFIKDDVLWTEEGHRLSWRMMLRSRTGRVVFRIVNKETQASSYIRLKDYLTKKQGSKIAAYPDFIWQFAQRLEEEYAAKGEDIAVYVNTKVRINGRPAMQLIDPNVDLAAEEWDHLRHHKWILPSPLDKKEIKQVK